MIAYVIRRLITGLVVVWIISVLAFLLVKLVPGDPAVMIAGPESTLEELELIRQKLWLDRPLYDQYVHWISNIARGDLGMSVRCREDVSVMIIRKAPITLFLSGLAFLVGAIVGTTAGVISAIRRGSILDSVVTVFANFGLSVPGFWLGIMLIYVVGLQLGWLPVCGWTAPWENFWLGIRKAIMPIFVLSFYPTAFLARQTRSSMLDVINEDYIRTAWSKGLRERVVIIRHALRNAFIPIITVMGLIVAALSAGSVITETVFNIPGLGRLLVDGVMDNDFVVVQSCVLVFAVMVLFINLLVDISYGWFDPRIRYR